MSSGKVTRAQNGRAGRTARLFRARKDDRMPEGEIEEAERTLNRNKSDSKYLRELIFQVNGMSPFEYISRVIQDQYLVCQQVADKSASNIITMIAIAAGVSVQRIQTEHETLIQRCFDECFPAACNAQPEIMYAFERGITQQIFQWAQRWEQSAH